MFSYEKKLQYPVKIANPNPKLARIILTQYGGPDGELGASLRYLSQRYSMPFDELKGLLTDVGTEELGHLEMIGAIVHQLTRNLKGDQIKDPAFAPYFVDHTVGVYPAAASGTPWSAATIAVKGDPMADLVEDMAADAASGYTAIASAALRATRSRAIDSYTKIRGFDIYIAFYIDIFIQKWYYKRTSMRPRRDQHTNF